MKTLIFFIQGATKLATVIAVTITATPVAVAKPIEACK